MNRTTAVALILYAMGAVVCYGPAYNERMAECQSVDSPEYCTNDAPAFAVGKAIFWPLFISVQLSKG